VALTELVQLINLKIQIILEIKNKSATINFKQMNKLKTVIVLATMLLTVTLFTSCDSDDDGGQPSIVGTWLLTASTSETIDEDGPQGITNNTVDEDNFTRLTFNSDGTFTEFFSDSFGQAVETGTDSGTYTISDNVLSITYDGDNETFNSDFTLSSGNRLIIIFTEQDQAINTSFVTTSTYTRQ